MGPCLAPFLHSGLSPPAGGKAAALGDPGKSGFVLVTVCENPMSKQSSASFQWAGGLVCVLISAALTLLFVILGLGATPGSAQGSCVVELEGTTWDAGD